MEVILTEPAHDFIEECVMREKGEIGGLGYVTLVDDMLIVEHAFLVPQVVSGGSVEFHKDSIAIGMERAANENSIDKLRFSWHSHGTMDTFWSNTDEGAIGDYLHYGAPWLLSLVTNRQGKHLWRLDINDVAVVGHVKLDKLNYSISRTDRTNGRAEAEITANVTRWTQTKWKSASKRGGGKVNSSGNERPQQDLGNGGRKALALPPGGLSGADALDYIEVDLERLGSLTAEEEAEMERMFGTNWGF